MDKKKRGRGPRLKFHQRRMEECVLIQKLISTSIVSNILNILSTLFFGNTLGWVGRLGVETRRTDLCDFPSCTPTVSRDALA
jgi:hypothetical protein